MTYGYKTLKEFKEEYIREAKQSIIVPEYSTNKEFDQQLADLMKEKFSIAPTKMFIKMNGYLRRVVRDDWEIKIIGYMEERETYEATLNSVEALNINYIPTIYSYITKKKSDLLNSCALGYGNNINVFLSYGLFHEILKGIKEKEFIIGHELGHNQNNATAVHILGVHESNEVSRLGEYTADRAGLLVCRDVEAAVRALLKVSSSERASEEDIKKAAKNMVENAERKCVNLPGDKGTHPCIERRVMALKDFYSSQMYARLTGNPVKESMLSDEKLKQRLAKLVNGGQ